MTLHNEMPNPAARAGAQIAIATLAPAHFVALEELQRICYPTLGAQELMRVEHFASQYRIFAQGQFVALAGDRVIGQGSGFLTDFDLDQPDHTFRDFTDNFYFRTHNPQGDYYYGADISVHPEWRGRGVGKLIYRARMDLVRALGRKGIIAGGMLPGYVAHAARLTPRQYAERVARGELYDPTLSFQLKMGFQLRGMIENYMEDSATGNWSTLILWPNDHLPARMQDQPHTDQQS
jgi:GNAT superfamily N-acetyltransferase